MHMQLRRAGRLACLPLGRAWRSRCTPHQIQAHRTQARGSISTLPAAGPAGDARWQPRAAMRLGARASRRHVREPGRCAAAPLSCAARKFPEPAGGGGYSIPPCGRARACTCTCVCGVAIEPMGLGARASQRHARALGRCAAAPLSCAAPKIPEPPGGGRL